MIVNGNNHNPKRLVEILKNFTKDSMKYTTHIWDFDNLNKSEYRDFEGFINAIRLQFDLFKDELKELSPNLYKKIYTFLFENNPSGEYSWYQYEKVNIGWSSLKGLDIHCNHDKTPDSYKLPNSIVVDNKEISTYGEIISLFKQEIEIRNEYNGLEYLFNQQQKKFGRNASIEFSGLNRQFYTDTVKIESILDRIFNDIRRRCATPTIKVFATELEDHSIEIRVIHVNSYPYMESERDSIEKFSAIKNLSTNICDFSYESSYDGIHYKVNLLQSNDAQQIENIDNKPEGLTYIMRFYK